MCSFKCLLLNNSEKVYRATYYASDTSVDASAHFWTNWNVVLMILVGLIKESIKDNADSSFFCFRAQNGALQIFAISFIFVGIVREINWLQSLG